MRNSRQPSIRRTGALLFQAVRALPLAACLAAALIVGGCSGHQNAEQAPVVSVEVATAESKDIHRTILADGLIYPHDQAAIVPKINAPVRKIFVSRGSQVHAGQLLAELENTDLLGAVTDSEGSYQQAEAGYAMAVQKAQQDLKVAQEQLSAQQKLYDSRQKLYEQGAVSAKDVQDAQIALTQAESQYGLAQKQFDLKSAEGQLTSAKGKQTSAEAQLSYSKIFSPIDGVITDSPYYPGETPPSGAPLLTVMDLSKVTARAHVSEQDAALLKVGARATITAPNVSVECPGKITLISPALDPSSTTVEIWIESNNTGGRLKAGSSVHVSLAGQSVGHATVIPAAALVTGDDGAVSVLVLGSDGKPSKVAVKPGIRNADEVEIVAGLKMGDKVITTGAFELSQEDPDVLAKTKVKVEAADTASGGDKAPGDKDP